MSDHDVARYQNPPGGREILEAALLFAVFFLPGYINQPASFNPARFSSLTFHLNYLLQTLPRIGLILYLLYRTRSDPAGRYGLRSPSLAVLPSALLTFTGALAISMFMSLAALQSGLPGPFADSPASAPQALPPLSYPLLLITCLTIGYYEELFFRAYLLGEFAVHRAARIPAAIAAALLFAAGHGYQGIVGFAGTFLIGIFLAHRFYRNRSLHEIAIGHGLYNFAAILLLYSRV
jgi:membrane protease YdiL (CAAX protease family)